MKKYLYYFYILFYSLLIRGSLYSEKRCCFRFVSCFTHFVSFRWVSCRWVSFRFPFSLYIIRRFDVSKSRHEFSAIRRRPTEAYIHQHTHCSFASTMFPWSTVDWLYMTCECKLQRKKLTLYRYVSFLLSQALKIRYRY